MDKAGTLRIPIILLVIATAAIHLALGTPNAMWMFVANGIGYLALATALYLPQLKQYSTITRWALIVYTLITIVAWVAIGSRNTIGYVDKLIEVALVVLLYLDGRK